MASAEEPLWSDATSSRESLHGGLHRLVTEKLGQAIASGELREGQKIVPEELGESLDVSRTVMRESLRVLAAKGMVKASPRAGTKVTGIEQWSLLDPDVIMWRVRGPQRDDQLRELMSLRYGIEPLAAAGAAQTAGQAEIDALYASCNEMEAAATAGNLALFTRADISFHTQILASSGNLIYRQFARPIEAVLMARKNLEMMPPTVESVVVAHHRAIADAIAARDADRAEELTRELVGTARAEILHEVERQSTGS